MRALTCGGSDSHTELTEAGKSRNREVTTTRERPTYCETVRYGHHGELSCTCARSAWSKPPADALKAVKLSEIENGSESSPRS